MRVRSFPLSTSRCTKNPETADLVTFTEEILNEKLHFLCSESCQLNGKDIFVVSIRQHAVHMRLYAYLPIKLP